MPSTYVTPDLFWFLAELAQNNDRAWFDARRDRYEEVVRVPLLRLIEDFEAPLSAISPHLEADARRTGGSLFRIHRDTRFSRDKSPYKTWAAIQFRHEKARNVHAPGYYLHLQPGNVFAAAGVWRPDREALGAIRERIAESPEPWRRLREDLARAGFRFEGESLKRVPGGFDAAHPAAEELKRKDYVVVRTLGETEVCAPDFLERYEEVCRSAAPLMRYLTAALGLPW